MPIMHMHVYVNWFQEKSKKKMIKAPIGGNRTCSEPL